MNENGEHFADLCALNQLLIGGSIFPHKRIHKATWISPNHVTENQIDHICISRKFRRSWQDVRMMRVADVSSDHHLLMTTVRLRLKRFTIANSTRTKYNVGPLRDKDTQAAFQISLSNRFQPLQELIEDNEKGNLKHSGNTARSSGKTHVKRSLARRRSSTRNGSLPTPSTSLKQGEREREENCAEQQPNKSS